MKPPSDVVRDRIGRSTPRGTVFGFLSAAHQGDFALAAQYLDTPLKGMAANELASEFVVVLDRGLPARLDQVSDNPNGSLNDALPLGRESVGVIQTSDGPLEVDVERVRREGAMIRLFSTETLEKVPGVYRELSPSSAGEHLPAWMQTPGWLSIPLWQWLALAAGLAVALGISELVRHITLPIFRRLFSLAGEQSDLVEVLAPPLRTLTVFATLHVTVLLFHLPLMARYRWRALSPALFAIVASWLFCRVVRVFGIIAGRRLAEVGKGESTSVVRLVERIINFTSAFVAIAVVAQTAGFHVTAIIAGLGVGGIAVALAAQKTLENLFGGVSIILDKPIRLGDVCRIGDQVGQMQVEDIGIRSTRFRTNERSVLTVPNGQLAVMKLENLGMRDKFLFQHVIGLRCETTSDQTHQALCILRTLLDRHPLVDPPSARVRFVRIGPSSLDLEVFAYVLTAENLKFLEVQEELLMGVVKAVESAGTKLALPSRMVYTQEFQPQAGTVMAKDETSLYEHPDKSLSMR